MTIKKRKSVKNETLPAGRVITYMIVALGVILIVYVLFMPSIGGLR